VVWAIVLLPELVRKLSGTRRSDTIRSFNHQLSVLDRSGRSGGARSNVIDLRSRTAAGPGTAPATAVAPSVRKRRQEVTTVLAAAAVLTLLCTVAFGTAFLVLHVIADALLITYLVLVNQANQAAARAAAPVRQGSLAGPAWDRSADLRTASVGRATPARRIAN
jgi:hypothetical protein